MFNAERLMLNEGAPVLSGGDACVFYSALNIKHSTLQY
jgi:hypothetical protein